MQGCGTKKRREELSKGANTFHVSRTYFEKKIPLFMKAMERKVCTTNNCIIREKKWREQESGREKESERCCCCWCWWWQQHKRGC